MRVEWHGQAAFTLQGDDGKVFIDPFGDMTPMTEGRDLRFEYPPIDAADVDLLLVTHEHLDHNGVEAIGGDPATLRATAGTHESPIGEVVGVASEHDESAGTERGPNTIFVFELDGVRVAHFGDFGQAALRPEQREAIGEVGVLFLPAGAGPTVAHDAGAQIVRELAPRVTVVMHYGNEAVDFLEPPDGLFDALGAEVQRLEGSEADLSELREGVTMFGVPRA
jgi:L-ascorbate metabolism protein UlaG (beta-lactamase superfamily)